MKINLVAYTRVAAGLAPKPPVSQRVDSPIEGFLSAHVTDLLEKANKDDAMPPGRFNDPEVRDLFQLLYQGSDDDFPGATLQLAERLIAVMNGRTREGLLLALRADGDAGRVAGLLKLQVVAEHGAVLERLDSGELQLSAVTDMLEKPGDLQKGALVTRSLPPDEVYCADRLVTAAHYFPEAFGIRLFAKPSAATKTFFEVAHRVAPEQMAEIAARWPALESGYTRDVIGRLAAEVPDLTQEMQEEMIERLADSPRSVVRLDTGRRVKETYKIGGITLSGPIEEMVGGVHVQERPEGGWTITLNSSDEPSPVYTSTMAR
ncbi:hypothetical protein [Catenulispora pinisilvae]|uniref:hypothetical protein n=1 Tax=Catenulispora pinisilvae TaxID=2705253 RepID=UPI001891F067|nr:hypothetical protein [Catenulispora pinisilvae]